MDLGDQRAGGVDGAEVAGDGGGADGRRDAVGAVEDGGAVRDLVDAVDEDDAALAKALDDVPVVDDLVIDVERRAEEFEGAFEALDGHVDAGAEAARVGQDDSHDLPPDDSSYSARRKLGHSAMRKPTLKGRGLWVRGMTPLA